MESKEYFIRLDALRFFAFLAVFISHTTFFFRYPSWVNTDGTWAKTFLQIGDLGVSFFFVLSGFLISYLLHREYQSTQTISLKKFYIRRVLRIWPLYFLAIGLIALVSLSLSNPGDYKVSLHLSEISAYLLLVGNIYRAFWNTGNEMLSVLWSVAVEEQFYLFWPLLFLFFRRNIQWVIGLGVAVSIATRWYYHDAFDVREFYTFSVLSDLMIGAWCGINAEKLKPWVSWTKTQTILGSGILVTILLLIRGKFFDSSLPGWFAGIEPILFTLCFAGIVLNSAFRGTGEKRVSRALSYLGRISYGLYVFHMVSITIVLYLFGRPEGFLQFGLYFLMAFITTVMLAATSYKFWEAPFLRLKNRFSASVLSR